MWHTHTTYIIFKMKISIQNQTTNKKHGYEVWINQNNVVIAKSLSKCHTMAEWNHSNDYDNVATHGPSLCDYIESDIAIIEVM